MQTTSKIFLAALAILIIIPEAEGVMGVRRRTHRRTAVVVGTTATVAAASSTAAAQQQAAAAEAEAAAAKQETAEAQQQAAAAQQQAVAAPPAAQAPASTGQKLPLGTVVSALPPGCVSTPVGGVEYYYGGGNFYRAVFQGNTLVYVTAQPE